MATFGELDPEVALYCQQQQDQGIVPQLFNNQPPPVIIMQRQGFSQEGGSGSTATNVEAQPPPQGHSISTSSSSSGDSRAGGVLGDQHAAAFPISFLQGSGPSTGNEAAAEPKAPPPSSRGAAAQSEPHDPELLTLAEQLRACLQAADRVLAKWGAGCKGCWRGSQGGAGHTAGQELGLTAALRKGRVAFVDELQAKQQRSIESRAPQLAAELQQLMQRHQVQAGSSDPAGLYSIQLELRGGKRFTLDRFVNHSPQTGFSLVLPSGQLALPDVTISDSGCTVCLVDREWADAISWAYRPTRIQLMLADSTTSSVVGITEPAWGALAAGTPHESMAPLQALVVEGAGKAFKFAVGKGHMAQHQGYVIQHEQVFSYRAAAGHRHSIPVCCYEEEAAAAALLSQLQLPEAAGVATMGLGQCFALVADAGDALEQEMLRAAEAAQQQTQPLGGGGIQGAGGATGQDQQATAEGHSSHSAAQQPAQGEAVQQQQYSGTTQAQTGAATPGVAAGLAAAGAAASSGGTPSPAKRVSAWAALSMMGYGRPHAYYRGVAYLGQFLAFMVWLAWQCTAAALEAVGVPLQSARAAIQCYWGDLRSWWQGKLQPVPEFREPPSGRQPRRGSWQYEFLYRLRRGKPLTASVKRHAQRYKQAADQHDSSVRQHQAAVVVTGVSVRGMLPLMLLLMVCLVAQAVATPELLQATHLLTNSLAAWELSQLSRSQFAAAAYYNDLGGRSAAAVPASTAARGFFRQHAATAGAQGFPSYPGAVDPLKLDDLLPDGRRFSQLKDAYTVDEEHKWAYGNHPAATKQQQQRLKAMLVRNRQAFAYSMQELPGYQGERVSVQLVHDKPIISKPRQYSKLEEQIRDEKCEELRDAGFIEPADPRNPYASCPTMPAKKNEQGEWTERRFRARLQAHQCSHGNAALQPGSARAAVPAGGRSPISLQH